MRTKCDGIAAGALAAMILLMFAAMARAEPNRQLALADVCGPFASGDGWGPAEPAFSGASWGNILSGGNNVGGGVGPSQDQCVSVVWYFPEPDSPFLNGRSATVTLPPAGGAAKEIRMRVLDGLATLAFGKLLDSFQVAVTNRWGHPVEVYSFDPGDGTAVMPPTAVGGTFTPGLKPGPLFERYRCHRIPLPVQELAPGQPITVTIMATGSAWLGTPPAGVLVAVDFIELVGGGGAQLPEPLCQ